MSEAKNCQEEEEVDFVLLFFIYIYQPILRQDLCSLRIDSTISSLDIEMQGGKRDKAPVITHGM